MRNKKKHLYWICNKWVSVYHVIYSVQDNILVKMDDTQAYMWKTESIKTVKTSIIEVSGCFGAGVDTCMTNLSVHQHDGSLGKKKKKKAVSCVCLFWPAVRRTRWEKLFAGCDGSAAMFPACFLSPDIRKPWMEGRLAPKHHVPFQFPLRVFIDFAILSLNNMFLRVS